MTKFAVPDAMSVDAAEPAIPRPSSKKDLSNERELAWAGSAGWALCSVALLVYAVAPLAGRSSFTGFLIASLAVGLSAPVFSRLAKPFSGLEMAGLLRLGLGAKLLATLPRFEARQDSLDYHRIGSALSERFWRLDFAVDPGASVPGTGSVRYVTGIVEMFTLTDEFATFVVFSLTGFVGLVAFILACHRAVPAVDIKRYALLVLFWPTLLYWPSSIGKESLMLCALGIVAYGAALLIQGEIRGLPIVVVALFAVGFVRPHVALIALTALLVAFIVRSPGRGLGSKLTRIVMIGALLMGGSVASDAVEGFFDIDGLNPSGLAAALDLATNRSAQGGSLFDAARIDGISEYPWGFVTVLFRPFPQEAVSIPMLVTSIEGLLFAVMMIGAIPRVLAVLPKIREEAFVAYAVAFTAVFVYLFSALGNFGILARQRAMTIPLALVIVALPTAKDRVRRHRLRAAS